MPTARRFEAFDDLLPALARTLDAREIFRHCGNAAAPIVPHDEANLALLNEDGTHLGLYAIRRDGDVELVARESGCPLGDPTTPHVVTDMPTTERGARAGVSAPVRVDGELVGVLALLSRGPYPYSELDLRLVQHLAEYVAVAVAHERLSEVTRQAAVERELTASIESSDELLRAISGVLDIRTVFPRVSDIVRNVLPHDSLTMMFGDRRGAILIETTTTDGFPELGRLVTNDDFTRDGSFVVDDFSTATLPIVEPADVRQRVLAAGYRSVLVVLTSACDHEVGLAFWSTRPGAFSRRDLPVARRVANHVALAVSHEQLAEAARQVAEAQARAERLESRVRSMTEALESKMGHRRVVGRSAEWLDVLKKATRVAETETTVLLSGESGTGKEIVARLIHRASPRKGGPFVALNCAALPEQLLESELFGHERGAFTGAHQSKPGQIEVAAGGVLFLDEVGELPPSAQAKFLRALQEREFQRLGGTRVQRANVRVVAATNRDLQKAVERGDFREDLYYRLNVFDIRVAPLRERRGDILPLSQAFLEEIGTSFGRPPAGLRHDAKQALLRHEWPGNVRELRDALERAVILCEGSLISARHLSLQRAGGPACGTATGLNGFERAAISQASPTASGTSPRRPSVWTSRARSSTCAFASTASNVRPRCELPTPLLDHLSARRSRDELTLNS